jgi:hypothetical protein
MRKLLASLAVAAALAIGATAHAAAVDINVTQDSAGSTSWTLTVDLAAGQTLGALSFLTRGLDSFNLNTSLTNVSPPDSVFSINPLGDGQNALIVNNNALGAALGGGPGPLHLLIGAFIGATTAPPVSLANGDNDLGGTAFDANANPIADYSLTLHPAAPEPASALLLGLGLASLALVRRKA